MKILEHTEKAEHSAHLRDSKVRVAGLKFRIDNFNDFLKEIKGLEMDKNIVGLSLIQDPNNEYNPDAIKVMGYTKAKGAQSVASSFHIGYLPKPLSKKLKDEGVKATQLFAELTDLMDGSPKVILDLYKV